MKNYNDWIDTPEDYIQDSASYKMYVFICMSASYIFAFSFQPSFLSV